MGIYDDLDNLKTPPQMKSQFPTATSTDDTPTTTTKRTPERTNVASVQRTAKRIIERPKPRTLIRHTFDIYQDQLTALRKLQLETITIDDGTKIALGEMVREALDAYLPRRQKGKSATELTNDRLSERPNERTNEPEGGSI